LSKIALSGNASGSGTLTLSAPNTNTDRTLTLPDVTGTIVTTGSSPSFPTTIGVGGATPAASGSGITFPATQSASSNANTLDDYEEGTFTPTAYGSTTEGTTTYVGRAGRYTKIGNMVFIEVHIEVSAMTGTGALYFSVPFAPASANEPRGVGSVFVTGLDWQNAGSICFLTNPGDTYGRLFVSSDNAIVTVVNVENGAWEVRFSVAYTV
jgi:hypothetical protein